MKPTKEQWDAIKKELSQPFGRAYFCCDGYLILATVTYSKMRLSIAVFVDGEISGKNSWVGKESKKGEMSEISRRFWSISKRYPDARSVKISEEIFGKKECKASGFYEPNLITNPFFLTPGAFIAHLKRNNESIEVLDADECKRRLDEKKGVKNEAH